MSYEESCLQELQIANSLKHCEEALEQGIKEIPLGVPSDGGGGYTVAGGRAVAKHNFSSLTFLTNQDLLDNLCLFRSKESAERQAKMLYDWRKALVDIAEGNPIEIKAILPLLQKGWVWMQKDKKWFWSKEKPELFDHGWRIWHDGYAPILIFNIKSVANWQNSLTECGL